MKMDDLSISDTSWGEFLAPSPHSMQPCTLEDILKANRKNKNVIGYPKEPVAFEARIGKDRIKSRCLYTLAQRVGDIAEPNEIYEKFIGHPDKKISGNRIGTYAVFAGEVRRAAGMPVFMTLSRRYLNDTKKNSSQLCRLYHGFFLSVAQAVRAEFPFDDSKVFWGTNPKRLKEQAYTWRDESAIAREREVYAPCNWDEQTGTHVTAMAFTNQLGCKLGQVTRLLEYNVIEGCRYFLQGTLWQRWSIPKKELAKARALIKGN